MVSYYQTESIPNPMSVSVTSVLPNLETMNPVKNLVCSPDLPVFGSATCATAAAAVAAAAAAAAAAAVTVDTLTNATEEKAYQCLLCQKSFDQKSLYQSHLRSHGKEGEDPYRCNICEKTFAVPARLTRHYRTHTGEKPYQCEYCSKSFSVKENLSVHRRIHTKERPYKCDVCERAFEHSGKLHRHMRIHTGERPHKCTVCSKTFIQSGQLVIHMRTHTGEKPYVCKSCGKGFTCSKQLKVHTRTHTGEKPYTCDICGKSFGYNHVLKLHQVAHYGEKVYKCTLCHETFGSKKTMELHIKTHSDSSSTSSGSSTTSSSSSSSSTSSGVSSARDSPIESIMEISQSNSLVPTAPSPIPICTSLTSKELPRKNQENIGSPNVDSYTNQRDFSYYVFPREQYPQSVSTLSGPMSLLNAGVEERSVHQAGNVEQQSHVFLYSDISSSPYPISEFAFPSRGGVDSMVGECPSLLNLPGNDARRRVEAALEAVEEERQREYGMNVKKEEPILTPPSSNPVSPAPSPDPLDLAIPVRETLILPPRKRCKMILESMESERSASLIGSQRQSSVIHFARAS